MMVFLLKVLIALLCLYGLLSSFALIKEIQKVDCLSGGVGEGDAPPVSSSSEEEEGLIKTIKQKQLALEKMREDNKSLRTELWRVSRLLANFEEDQIKSLTKEQQRQQKEQQQRQQQKSNSLSESPTNQRDDDSTRPIKKNGKIVMPDDEHRDELMRREILSKELERNTTNKPKVRHYEKLNLILPNRLKMSDCGSDSWLMSKKMFLRQEADQP